MDNRPKITLEYSSPAMETRPEIERRRAVEDYNQATYGERHPFRAPFVRRAVLIALLAIPFFLLPRRMARDVCAIMCIIFPLFELWWCRYR